MLSLAASHILMRGRYTWRHNSALHFVAPTLQSVRNSSLYADLPGFLSPCIIVNQLRPDMLLSIGKTTLYMIELTVGFETNLNCNAERKQKNISLFEIFRQMFITSNLLTYP